jgi:uncharacterized protein YgbK (DUF1537 family)
LREEGFGVAVVDCLNERHVETICRAAADLRLVTGGSAFGMKLPAVWRERGWLSDHKNEDAVGIASSKYVGNNVGTLVVAGSCSVATRAQNDWLEARGARVTRLDPRRLLANDFDRDALVIDQRASLSGGLDCLLATTGAPSDVRDVQAWGSGRQLSVPELGERIAYALADIVLEVLRGQTTGGLVVAGGETSGAVCRRLGLGALRVGRNIEPGVPLCLSLGDFRLPIVLKSGNFGGTDFYGKALSAVSHAGEYMR